MGKDGVERKKVKKTKRDDKKTTDAEECERRENEC